MNGSKTAVVLGATGMIGQELTQLLLSDPEYSAVRVLVRKPVGIQHPKLEVMITNFDDLDTVGKNMGKGDIIFSCVGTTQKKVKGDKGLYRKVDHDIPVNAARLAQAAGFSTFLLVSSVGANVNSSSFYLRLKGEVEESLSKIGIESLHIFQPSMLLGSRKEQRPAEVFFQKTFKAIAGLLAGKLRKYRPIEGATVARAMVQAAKHNKPGKHIYTYVEMAALQAGAAGG
ncbi:MAG: NAD(P)H-binding protein [Chitinophagaceae bacterium]|nr:NAD(P)H-binding protein [Chitinophagaceae bacterium]